MPERAGSPLARTRCRRDGCRLFGRSFTAGRGFAIDRRGRRRQVPFNPLRDVEMVLFPHRKPLQGFLYCLPRTSYRHRQTKLREAITVRRAMLWVRCLLKSGEPCDLIWPQCACLPSPCHIRTVRYLRSIVKHYFRAARKYIYIISLSAIDTGMCAMCESLV